LKKCLILICAGLLLVACAKQNVKSIQNNAQHCDCPQQTGTTPIQLPDSTKSADTKPPVSPNTTPDYALLKLAKWEDIDGFAEDDISATWPAWLQSCSTLKNKSPWQAACNAAATLNKPNKQAVQAYFVQYFNVYSTNNADGTDAGLITGYYEPMLKGSRTKSSQYPHPLWMCLLICSDSCR